MPLAAGNKLSGAWARHYHIPLGSIWALRTYQLQLTLDPGLLNVEHFVAKVLISHDVVLGDDVVANRPCFQRGFHVHFRFICLVDFVRLFTHVAQAVKQLEGFFIVQVSFVHLTCGELNGLHSI